MSGKKKTEVRAGEQGKQGESDYYKLKTDAVERLVTASVETSPEVSDEEIARISGRKTKWSIPNYVKALFIKWWINGAACFFIYFGLGTYVTAQIDLLFIFGVALGIFNDLLTNHLLRFIEKYEGQNDRFIMVKTRKFWSLFLNVPYAFLVLYSVVFTYNIINYLLVSAKGADNVSAIGVEPILFGILYLAFDMLYIGIRRLMGRIVEDAKKQVQK